MASALAHPEPAPQSLRRIRILAVDDLEVVHWGYRLLFSRVHWVERCVAARTVDDAVEMARRFEPHLAIVETIVDGQRASDVVAQLKAAWPPLRVLLTAHGS